MSTTRISGRRSAILPTLIIAAVLVVAFAIFTSFWTDRLWYQSLDFGTVFTTMLLTRIGLFVAFGLMMAALVGGNAVLAYRLRSKTRLGPPTSPLLERYRELLDARLVWVVLAVAVLVGLFAGGAAAGQVTPSWPGATPPPSGSPTPSSGWTSASSSSPTRGGGSSPRSCSPRWSSARSSRASCTTSPAGCGSPDRSGAAAAPPRRTCRSWSVWPCWSRASATGSTSTAWRSRTPPWRRLFTGINYTADNATVNAKLILAVIAGICALLFFANAVLRRWVIPVIGLTLLILSSIVLGIVYPGAVQYFSVRPDEPDKERTYIARNIAATRAAYGVDNVEITDYSAKTTADRRPAALRRRGAAGHPADGPGRGQPRLRAAAAGPRLLQVRPRPWTWTATPSTAPRPTPWSRSARWTSRHRGPELEQPPHRLHPRLRPGRRVRQQAAVRRRAGVDRPRHPAARARSTSTSRGSTSARSRPTTPSSARPRAARRSSWTPRAAATAATRDLHLQGQGGVPIGNLWHRLLYAAKFADVNILLSDRVNERVQDHLRPDPAGAGAEGRPVAEGRRRPVPGGGRRSDRVDRRRLHHVELLPLQPAGRPQRGHLGLPDHGPGHQRGGPARHQRQLHPQLGQGRRRRLRRQRQAVRLGRDRPGAADLGEGVPRR